MSVIDSGLITESLKSHLVELEAQRVATEKGLAKAKLEEPKLEREAVIWFLQRFRNGNRNDPMWRVYLVDTFLQAAYLYDETDYYCI